MTKRQYKVRVNLEYVQGHLRDGHYEGVAELTDEQAKQLLEKPSLDDLDLNFRVDDFEIDDCGIEGVKLTTMEGKEMKAEDFVTETVTAEADWCRPDAGNTEGSDFKFEVSNAPDQGTDAWLAWRKQGITATEAGAIMFPDSHRSPMKVYSDKLGLTQNDQSDPEGFMEWGHRIEDLLIDKFMEQHPLFRMPTHGRLYQRDWCKCSLDGQCYDQYGNPVIIECKTGQNEAKWAPIPDNYYAQVQWQMYVTGIRKAYFAVLIRGHHYFEVEVEFNLAFVKKMLEKCKQVWDCIQTKTPPAALGFFAVDKEAISAMAGETGHSGEPEEVDDDLVETYNKLKKAADDAEEAFTAFKNVIAYKMVDKQKLLNHGKVFATWVERKGTVSVDKNKLATKYPDAYADCLKQGAGTRYIKYSV